MDSQAINKLIRSEIWPDLRSQVFSQFGSRSAFRYRRFLIDVVNFQSFNTHLADGLGCTTFSFALNLGVYVIGGRDERRLKQDKQGRWLPHEYECQFRAKLLKRSAVDGFARKDIFSIDPAGLTAVACIEEARSLLIEIAPSWFDLFSDLSQLAQSLETTGALPFLSDYLTSSLPGNVGSVNWHEALATIRLARFRADPTAVNKSILRDETAKLLGTYLDLPQTISSARITDSEVQRIAGLLDEGNLSFGSPKFSSESDWKAAVKQHLWPLLKNDGFTEFSTRVARRTVGQAIQMVEVTLCGGADRKLGKTSLGAFCVRLGMFLPLLPIGRFGETEAPLTLDRCHISTWLRGPGGDSGSLQSARNCLVQDGLSWFALFASPNSALITLQKSEWELYSMLPMTRNVGSRVSAKRSMLLSFFAYLCHDAGQARDHLAQAATLIELKTAVNLVRNYRAWYRELAAMILG